MVHLADMVSSNISLYFERYEPALKSPDGKIPVEARSENMWGNIDLGWQGIVLVSISGLLAFLLASSDPVCIMIK